MTSRTPRTLPFCRGEIKSNNRSCAHALKVAGFVGTARRDVRPVLQGLQGGRGPVATEVFELRSAWKRFPRDHPKLDNFAHKLDVTPMSKLSQSVTQIFPATTTLKAAPGEVGEDSHCMRALPAVRGLSLGVTMLSMCSSTLCKASAAFISPSMPSLSSPHSVSHRCRSSLGSTSEQASDPQANADTELDLGDRAKDVITVQFKGQTFQGEKGELLRTILLRNNVTPHNKGAQLINCRGLGTCGTCAVQIEGQVGCPMSLLVHSFLDSPTFCLQKCPIPDSSSPDGIYQ
eukprot:560456-Rhodomonas_salina.2